MYILTVAGKENKGAYSVLMIWRTSSLFVWEHDDATRFAYQLEDGYPEMNVIEVEDEVMLKTCHVHNYNFTVITPNDIVIPPSEKHDFIWEYTLKNFLSTGNQYTEIAFNKSSTTLIVGTNGAGKSTVLDALTFSLFNKPFRRISKGQLTILLMKRIVG